MWGFVNPTYRLFPYMEILEYASTERVEILSYKIKSLAKYTSCSTYEVEHG